MSRAAHANAPVTAWQAVDCKKILEEIGRLLMVLVDGACVAFWLAFVVPVIDDSLNVADVLIVVAKLKIAFAGSLPVVAANLLKVKVNPMTKTRYR